MKKTLLIFCTFCILLIFNGKAQVDSLSMHYLESEETITVMPPETTKHATVDSVQMKKHSPKKATLLALIPGAGQIYNKKYWKLPIVYGGLGATSFLIYYFADQTTIYRKEYVARVMDYPDQLNPKLADEPVENILKIRNDHRRNMEICVAACAIVYALSILDACVDAHLYYYDVSENLAIGIKPKIDYHPVMRTTTTNLAFILKF